ncbi:MAG: hypothetical protein RL329_4145 [Bacteroidota bacterium]|jgi:hypothetical protein
MLNSTIAFYTPPQLPRLRYIVDFIFNKILGINVLHIPTEKDWFQSSLPKIWYGSLDTAPKTPAFILAKHHPILTEKGLKSHIQPDFGADGLARAFFEISRYEEYIAKNRDIHGRFTGAQSYAFKTGSLQRPIVHEIAEDLKQKLRHRYANIVFGTANYTFLPTYDIDMAWRYAHKGLIRSGLAGLRDGLRGDFKTLYQRIQVYQGRVGDPDFVFDDLEQLHQKKGLKPIFFWLLGDYAAYDKNIDSKNKHFQNLIRNIAKQYAVGIHPSYRSNQHLDILKMEVSRLQQMLRQHRLQKIEMNRMQSRQHFLKLTLPTTYRRLIAAGITDDYTMGYADQIGFRAGVAIPFNWYDVEKDAVTNLIIHPFQVMDVTLQQYLKLSPTEAVAAVKPLIEITKSVGGTFTTLWHNSSLSEMNEWKGWRVVYESIVDNACDKSGPLERGWSE